MREEEHGGSIVLDSMSETGENDVWTPVSVASYWLQVVSAWIFPHMCFYSIKRGRCLFRLAIPLSGQLLWGSCGSPHNDFLGRAQVLSTIEVVRDLCPQRLQICLYLV